jgi:hypothetical protein
MSAVHGLSHRVTPLKCSDGAFLNTCIYLCIQYITGARASIVVKVYAASPKVAGWRPDEVNLFTLPNPSGRIKPWGSLILYQK